jgi:hypothetical protein
MESKLGNPRVHGFPGLPAYLDRPKIKRYAKENGVSEKEAERALRNTAERNNNDQ